MDRFFGWILLLVTVAAGAPALGQADVVELRALPQRAQVSPGDRFAVAVVMEFAEGYHAWPAEVQDLLAPEIAEFAVHTEIVVEELPGAVEAVGPVQWPAAHEVEVADPTGMQPTVKTMAFSGRSIAYVPVAIAPDASLGSVNIDLVVSYQVCDDKQCLMPEDRPLQVTVEVVEPAAAAASPETEPGLFSNFDARVLAALGAAAPAEPDGAAADPSEAPGAPSAARRPSLFGYGLPDPSSAVGLFVLLLVSAIGGAVLNLTPCVLPVIPIKVMTLSQHAGEPSRRLVLGIWMAAGVVAFWTAIGLPMAFISAAWDPSRLIFGNWYVVLTIGLLIALMGVGVMRFSLNLPQWLYMLNPKADSAMGSFLFGVMTAVLGLPCFGFVAGGLLAGSAALGAAKIMVIFVGLGVGMAAPYLVLSAKPGLIERIPRTGPASELVKQVMGLLLIAAAAFFVTAGVKGLLSEMPYVKEAIGWWVVTAVVLVAAAWLTLRTFQITRKTGPRVVLPLLALAAVGGLFVFASGLTSVAREDHLRRTDVLAGGAEDELVAGAWNEFSPARMEKALASDKVVVVDFTADWCINCKFLKRTVLDRDPVRPRLLADDVIMLEVDLTSTKAPGWSLLQELGQTGVPTLAIFGPGVADPIIYNAYTPEVVLGAIERAAAPATARAAAPASPAQHPTK